MQVRHDGGTRGAGRALRLLVRQEDSRIYSEIRSTYRAGTNWNEYTRRVHSGYFVSPRMTENRGFRALLTPLVGVTITQYLTLLRPALDGSG